MRQGRPFPDDPGPGRLHLRVLATTDIHTQIHPHDYEADRPVEGLGLARLADLIARLRAETPNTLLLDNGDILQGTPLADHVAETAPARRDAVHPAIAAMNVIGYDAATLGNHEFNYGLDFLARALAAARFPFTCANVLTHRADDPEEDETWLPPFVILERRLLDGAGTPRSVRIGVIGFVPPQVTVWDRWHLAGRIATRDIVSAAAARLAAMRNACDIVIALCHSGIAPPDGRTGRENAALDLAALPGIDVVVAGHSHLVFPGDAFRGIDGVDCEAGTLAGKPAVMAGAFGSHLGVVDLLLEPAGAGWRVATSRAQAIPAPAAAAQPPHSRTTALLAATLREHNETLAQVRQKVGHSDIPLSTHFAALPGNAALSLIARAQAWHVAMRLRGTPYATLPLLSAATPFKMGGRGGPGFYTDIPAGPIALRHVAALYPFPNAIRAVLVTGSQLRLWLERSAALFRQIAPGSRDALLIDRSVPPSDFDVIHGLTWQVDLAHPPAGEGDRMGRITDLRHLGRPVPDSARFVVATNSYRTESGFDIDAVILAEPERNRDILRRYLGQCGPVRPDDLPTWRFAPMPGASVIYETAPEARHPDTLPLRIESAGPPRDGFARFRVFL